MLLFQPPCSEAYNSRLSFRSKSKEQLNERRAGLSILLLQLSEIFFGKYQNQSMTVKPKKWIWANIDTRMLPWPKIGEISPSSLTKHIRHIFPITVSHFYTSLTTMRIIIANHFDISCPGAGPGKPSRQRGHRQPQVRTVSFK